ncbi:hypothetical protein CVIRNUC_001241 [Coccomyxa viridis]|uniref:Uncharacterized protein n=1 Tax=Coccomyxa viridis TaxID=1274662 RepID=A0AAV1HU93_9CHLO|nr:hypothetical protein CVIRNUC_001241 [Coccomyxa viridis]
MWHMHMLHHTCVRQETALQHCRQASKAVRQKGRKSGKRQRTSSEDNSQVTALGQDEEDQGDSAANSETVPDTEIPMPAFAAGKEKPSAAVEKSNADTPLSG